MEQNAIQPGLPPQTSTAIQETPPTAPKIVAAPKEPRNPFYLLLLLTGLAFIMTVLAYAVIPVLEQKALDAGQPVPPREESWLRNTLHRDGWKWVLAEVAALVILGLLSMGLDRFRRWKKENEESTSKN